MSSQALLSNIGSWLIEEALGNPEIEDLFDGMCTRVFAAGIPIERVMFNYTTLHPLFNVESCIWLKGVGTTFDQFPYRGDDNPQQAWLDSPLKFMIDNNIGLLRRHLDGPETLVDFPLLEEFVEKGMTDYIAFTVPLGLPGAGEMTNKHGMMMSFTSKRPGGFSDDDIEGLMRVVKRFSLASKSVIQMRISRTITETYLGKKAGDQVLSGQIHRGDGETIPAVIWYSDLRNSTQLSSELSREDYIWLLNRYFECSAGALIDNGGDVLDFIGDAVIGMWPVASEFSLAEMAMNATKAVVEARKRLDAFNAERSEEGLDPIDFGIGLNYGNMMFGNIGIAGRLSFSIIGPTVNKAARIESMTKELGVPVLATKRVARACNDCWNRIGEFNLRGFSNEVGLFEWRPETSDTLLAKSA